MTQRMVRVNELIKREISLILHTTFKAESVAISITEVEVSPDLRQAYVYFSVFGGALKEREATNFLKKVRPELKRRLSKAVTIKYMPQLNFRLDRSIDRGIAIMNIMDEIEREEGQEGESRNEDLDEKVK